MKEQLYRILEVISSAGGDVRKPVFERPATESEVVTIEEQLGYKIPGEFREILLTLSSNCEFLWFLPDTLELPENLVGIFSGGLHWGLELLALFHESKRAWIKEVFSDPEDEYDKVWHNKLVFQEVGNGDYLGIGMDRGNYGKIIYLSHDDGEGHGHVMADSFGELLDNWMAIGCVGPEDWQWLRFTEGRSSGINPDSENAKLWRQFIRLG